MSAQLFMSHCSSQCPPVLWAKLPLLPWVTDDPSFKTCSVNFNLLPPLNIVPIISFLSNTIGPFTASIVAPCFPLELFLVHCFSCCMWLLPLFTFWSKWQIWWRHLILVLLSWNYEEYALKHIPYIVLKAGTSSCSGESRNWETVICCSEQVIIQPSPLRSP